MVADPSVPVEHDLEVRTECGKPYAGHDPECCWPPDQGFTFSARGTVTNADGVIVAVVPGPQDRRQDRRYPEATDSGPERRAALVGNALQIVGVLGDVTALAQASVVEERVSERATD